MAGSHNEANLNWRIQRTPQNTVAKCDAQLAVLMDIRHELQRLNDLLHCPNFLSIPHKLDAIRCNTAKPRKPRKKP